MWIGPAVEQQPGVEVTFVGPEDVPAPVEVADDAVVREIELDASTTHRWPRMRRRPRHR